MIWNVRFCKYTTFPCNFCFFCFYIYINLNLSIWKYCISLILRPNYLSLSLVYQYISFKPLKTDGMLTDLVRGGALTGDLNMRFFWTRIKRIARIIFARGFYSVFYTHADLSLLTHTDRTDIVRGGVLTGGHEIFLNTRFAVGPLTEGR